MEDFGQRELYLQRLTHKLEGAGVDISKWGTSEAKSIEDLQREIDDGETQITESADGKLLRELSIGVSNVFYESPDGKRYKLIEEKQIFSDGRERRRGTEQSVRGKMKKDEDPKSAMEREIREELGIEGDIEIIDKGEDEVTFDPQSFPGLMSKFKRHNFDVFLKEGQFKPEGYVEKQGSLTTYFVWKEV